MRRIKYQRIADQLAREAERRAAPFTKTVPLASSLVQCHSLSLFLADGAPRTGPWILNPPSRCAGGGDSGAGSMRLAIVFIESKFGFLKSSA